nr:MAG TPA: Cysteine-rich small domain protein [Caudoviricetes sp.]
MRGKINRLKTVYYLLFQQTFNCLFCPLAKGGYFCRYSVESARSGGA